MSAPNPQRIWLGWDRPLVGTAADRLMAMADHGSGVVDLSLTLAVVPTRQAGRRLREALAVAAGPGGGLLPPRVVTPETLVDPGSGIAGRGATVLGWAEVLMRADLDGFRHLFPVQPDEVSAAWAMAAAAPFERARVLIADAGLSLEEAADLLPERLRWRDLANLEARLARLISQRGLVDRLRARQRAAENPEPPPGIARVLVIGVPDMPTAVETRLSALARRVPVELWVYAPDDLAAGFSEWGRPLAERWSERTLTVPADDRCLHLTPDPAGQARAVVEILRARPDPETRQVALATADPEPARAIVRELRDAGVELFDPEGEPLATGILHPCLGALAGLLGEGRWEAFRELVRQPLFWDGVSARAAVGESWPEVLAGFDRFYDRHLPVTFTDLAAAGKRSNAKKGWSAGMAAAVDHAEALVRGFASAPFAGAVEAALHGLPGALDDESAAALELAEELGAFAAGGGHRAGDLLSLLVRLLGEVRRYPDPPGTASGALLGWLELLWEDAPDLVVAGFNDGRVPEAVTGDALLPERARELLGLRTNADRVARDAYLLEAAGRSRAGAGGTVDIVLAKTAADGSPIRPSRLLFRCPDADLPERTTLLFGAPNAGLRGRVPEWSRSWLLRPPAPLPPHGERFPRLRVTDFSRFMACPFRFYLSRGLKMERIDPDKDEMDARDFGTVVHEALERLGKEPGAAECEDAAAIEDLLCGAAESEVRIRFGPRPPVPVRLQLEVAKERLRHVARVQADAVAAGWRIVHVEVKFGGDGWGVDGVPVTGTIDRVERHADGRVRVLDYKTSYTPKAPESAHLTVLKTGRPPGEAPVPEWRRADGAGSDHAFWTNLQLPIYCRWATREFPDAGEPVCGYFQIPAALEGIRIDEWSGGGSTALVGSAWGCAGEVARRVRAGDFWPPSARPEFDDFEELVPWEALGDSVDGDAWQRAFAEAAASGDGAKGGGG